MAQKRTTSAPSTPKQQTPPQQQTPQQQPPPQQQTPQQSQSPKQQQRRQKQQKQQQQKQQQHQSNKQYLTWSGAKQIILAIIIIVVACMGYSAYTNTANFMSASLNGVFSLFQQQPDYKNFQSDFISGLQNHSLAMDIAPMREIAQKMRAATSMIGKSMALMSNSEFNELDHRVIEKAREVMQQLRDIGTKSHDSATSNHLLMKRIIERLPKLTRAFKEGKFDRVNQILTSLEVELAAVLSELGEINASIETATTEALSLGDFAASSMKYWAEESHISTGAVQYPAPTIAALALTAGLLTFVSAAAAPFVALTAASGKLSILAGGVTAAVGTSQHIRADVRAAEMMNNANLMKNVVFSTQDIEKGLQVLMTELKEIKTHVRNCITETGDVKDAVSARDAESFAEEVGEIQKEYEKVASKYERILKEWYNSNEF